MAAPLPLSSKIRFGAFHLDAATGELQRSGIPIKLRLQAVQVLLMLTERAGQVVTREEIRERLWVKDTFVDFERGINFCINQIRATLGDSAEQPRFVETLPKRGYRFIAPVTVEVFRNSANIVHVLTPVETPVSQTPVSAPTTTKITPGLPADRPTQEVARGNLSRRWAFAAAVLFILTASGLAARGWLVRARGPSLFGLRPTKLTTSGSVSDVAISPDGRYVVYSKFEGDQQGLWLRQLAAQTDLQILKPGPGFHGLTFSPDGNYIYFVRADQQNPFFKYLYSMPAGGGFARKLITDVDSPVTFSPDGHRLIYEHCVENRDDAELRMADADGNDDHVVTILHNASGHLFQSGPGWSPDGRTVAVPAKLVGAKNPWVLDVVNVADGKVRELLSRSDAIGRPVWFRGDSLVVPLFDSVEHSAQLWKISFPGGNMQRITSDVSGYGANANDFGFPLDETRERTALVTLASSQIAKIWLAPATEPSAIKELATGDLALFHVAEAPDGKLWAVGGDKQLWSLNADGSQAARFGNRQSLERMAACGKFMVIVRPGKTQTFTLTRLDTEAQHPVDLVSGDLFGPRCSPDGKFVFYGSAEQPQKIWKVPLAGGQPSIVAKVLGDQISSQINLSPDGKLLVYGYTTFGPKLEWNAAIVSAEDGSVQRTIPVQPVDGFSPDWSADGRALLFLRTTGGVSNLWEQPLHGGKPKQVTHFTVGQIFDFSWSRDRKRLLFTRGRLSSDAVLLSNVR